MQNKTKLFGLFIGALILVVWFTHKEEKPKVDYVQLNDCYQKGYYDGRVAIYGTLRRGYITRSYLDSTYSADSTLFNKFLKK